MNIKVKQYLKPFLFLFSGVVIGIIVMAFIYGSSSHSWKYEESNRDNMRELFPSISDFDRSFQEMESKFKEMEKIHDDITRDGFRIETRSNLDVENGVASKNLNGSMSFYFEGNQYSVPYSVKDGKFNMEISDLRSYLDQNESSKFEIKIEDSSGNNVVDYDSLENLPDGEINCDLEDNENYKISILVTDKDDNVVVNIVQSL